MIVLYYTRIPIGFWYMQELNLKSLIQSLETLSIELIRIHKYCIPNISLFQKVWEFFLFIISKAKSTIFLQFLSGNPLLVIIWVHH